MKRFWILCGLLLTLTSCATVDRKAVEQSTEQKTIGVKVQIKPQINLLWVGTTVFNNEQLRMDVSNWQLSEAFSKAVVEALINTGRYAQVIPITEDVQIEKKWKNTLVPLNTPQADFVLVIADSATGDRVFNTNQSIIGIGIFQRSLFTASRNFAHAAMYAELFDARSGESLGDLNFLDRWPTKFKLASPIGLDETQVQNFKQQTFERIPHITSVILTKLGLQTPNKR